MIVKSFDIRSVEKSNFRDLVKYITNSQGNNHRIKEIQLVNFPEQKGLTDAAAIKLSSELAIITQSKNKRAKSGKNYHLMVSFRAGESPDSKTLKAIEQAYVDALGFSDHQRISAVHADTDNLHLHIAINKIHPENFSIKTPKNDYWILDQVREDLEKKYNLIRDNHIKDKQKTKSKSQNKADDLEAHSGEQSFLSFMKENLKDDLKNSKNWQEFNDLLSANGVSLKSKGNGFVFHASSKNTFLKASSLGREFSKKSLEKKFGSFQKLNGSIPQNPKKPKKEYKKKPIPITVDTAKLYAEYQKSRSRKKSWLDWLKKEALNGNLEALEALRGRRSAAIKRGEVYAWLSSKGQDFLKARKDVLVTKTGQLLIKIGKDTVRDDGGRLTVKGGVQDEAVLFALSAAAARYKGQPLEVNGSDKFKKRVSLLAAKEGLEIVFKDQKLEKIRQKEFLKHHDNKQEEKENESRRQPGRNESERTAEKDDGRRSGDRASADRRSSRAGSAGNNRGNRGNSGSGSNEPGKSNDLDRRGRKKDNKANRRSPAEFFRDFQRALRLPFPNYGEIRRDRSEETTQGADLSSLPSSNVVTNSTGSDQLLSGEKSGRMDNKKSHHTSSVRRSGNSRKSLPKDARLSPSEKYVQERTEKKNQGIIKESFEVQKGSGAYIFDGVRRVDNHSMVLLKSKDDLETVFVLEIDSKTENRVKRIRRGHKVEVNEKGTLITQPKAKETSKQAIHDEKAKKFVEKKRAERQYSKGKDQNER